MRARSTFVFVVLSHERVLSLIINVKTCLIDGLIHSLIQCMYSIIQPSSPLPRARAPLGAIAIDVLLHDVPNIIPEINRLERRA